MVERKNADKKTSAPSCERSDAERLALHPAEHRARGFVELRVAAIDPRGVELVRRAEPRREVLDELRRGMALLDLRPPGVPPGLLAREHDYRVGHGTRSEFSGARHDRNVRDEVEEESVHVTRDGRRDRRVLAEGRTRRVTVELLHSRVHAVASPDRDDDFHLPPLPDAGVDVDVSDLVRPVAELAQDDVAEEEDLGLHPHAAIEEAVRVHVLSARDSADELLGVARETISHEPLDRVCFAPRGHERAVDCVVGFVSRSWFRLIHVVAVQVHVVRVGAPPVRHSPRVEVGHDDHSEAVRDRIAVLLEPPGEHLAARVSFHPVESGSEEDDALGLGVLDEHDVRLGAADLVEAGVMRGTEEVYEERTVEVRSQRHVPSFGRQHLTEKRYSCKGLIHLI